MPVYCALEESNFFKYLSGAPFLAVGTRFAFNSRLLFNMNIEYIDHLASWSVFY